MWPADLLKFPGPTRARLVSINSDVVERAPSGITKEAPNAGQIPRVFETLSERGGKVKTYFCSILLRNGNIKYIFRMINPFFNYIK